MAQEKTEEKFVRAIRVIEYEGSREWLEHTLKNSITDGTHKFSNFSVLRITTIRPEEV